MTRQEFLRLLAGGSIVAGRADGAHAATAAGVQTPARSVPQGVTRAVADFITRASFDGMPERAIAEAKRCLIDGFGVVLAGASTHGSAIVREYVKGAGSASRESTVLGAERLSATAAH